MWIIYTNLLYLNQDLILSLLHSKYLVHFNRMIKMRKSTKKSKSLTKVLTLENFEKMTLKAEAIRKRFEIYLRRDFSRGLYFPQEFYNESLKAVLIHEVFEPDIITKNLFEVPVIESDDSDNIFDFGEFLRESKRHLVFL